MKINLIKNWNSGTHYFRIINFNKELGQWDKIFHNNKF